MNPHKKRILVVDDEPGITRMLKLNLEQTGEFVVQVENAALHALTAALAFQPDLILLDVLMPGVDGGQLAAHFQASPRLEKVPIIFLTAAATKQEVNSHGGQIGGLEFLAKSVDMPEVVASIRKHLAA
jgi:CheY-like chemotaxis protein